MSISGMIFLATLITLIAFRDKHKIGIFLFILYLLVTPFILFFLPVPFVLVSTLCLMSTFLVYFFLAKILRLQNNYLVIFLKSRQVQKLLCSILFIALLYLEVFNGIETFQNPNKFFDLDSKIYYKSGNVASYIILPLYGYELYLYKGVLYYYPISEKDFQFKENEPPGQHWVKWGHQYDYRPD